MTAIQFINVVPEEFIKKIGDLVGEKVKQEFKRLNPRSDDELLTHEEAARFLRVHPDTLRLYKKKGMIKFHRTGRILKYKKSDLEAFLKLQSLKESQNLNPINRKS